MNKRPKIPPIPLEELWIRPEWIGLPTAARGSLFSRLEHYWRTECRPLPTQNDMLAHLARAHMVTWRTHRKEVLGLLEIIRPGLERAYQTARYRSQSMHDALSLAGQRSAGKRALKRIRDKQENPLSGPTWASAMIPKKEAGEKIIAADIKRTRWEDHQAKIANGGIPVGAQPSQRKFRDRL